MQHPTALLAARDATPGWRCRRQRQDQAIVEPLGIPFVVVVRDELADGATPRALVDQDQALEAGVLDGAHEARRVGVQVRRAGGASEGGDIGRTELLSADAILFLERVNDVTLLLVDPARDGHDEELQHLGKRRHTGRAEPRLSAITNVATRRASSVE